MEGGREGGGKERKEREGLSSFSLSRPSNPRSAACNALPSCRLHEIREFFRILRRRLTHNFSSTETEESKIDPH